MTKEEFYSNKLSWLQRRALFIAMHVRNEMENFHCKYLTDEQMEELNPIIRQAILDALVVENKVIYDAKSPAWQKILSYLIMCIPDYWEIPTEKKMITEAKKLEEDFLII